MMKQNVNKMTLLKLLAIVLPVIMAGVIALFYWMRTGVIPFPMPQWNDEAVYYEQVKMWITVGVSKGYWGFQGNHAIIGTGGAWNPAILFPYVLWGKILGWHYFSIAFANVFFLCVANALFLFLVKEVKVWRLILLEVLSGHIILYSNTNMSEVLRYALAIVLAGLLYRLFFKKEGTSLFYKIVLGVFLLLLMQVYIFFAFAVPIYLYGLMKRTIWWKKIIVSLVVTGITAGGSYYLLHLISSNYNIYKTETLLRAIQEKEIGTAIKTFLWMAKEGLMDLVSCFYTTSGHGMFRWFVPFVAVLAVAPILMLMHAYIKDKNKATVEKAVLEKGIKCKGNLHDQILLCIVAYSIILYTGMYVTVYSLEAFTFYRGMGIVILFSLSILTLLHNRKQFVFFLLCYAVGLLFVPANMTDFNAERYVSSSVREEWDTLAAKLEKTITLDVSSDTEEERRINNTAVLYTMEPKLISAIPAGIGVDFMMYSDDIPEDAGYLIFSLQSEDDLRSDWLEQSFDEIYAVNSTEINENYFLQYKDDQYIIFKHNPE